MELRVDGEDVDLSRTLTYRGMMFGAVPNMPMGVGYTNVRGRSGAT
jgi:monooxygenase